MKTRLVGLIVLCGVSAISSAHCETNISAAVTRPDGTLSVPGEAEVPACGMTGKWTELPGKSSERYLSRHFMFLIPQQPPAMELYLTQDRASGTPDGLFEIGLVHGYVGSFASKAGFVAGDLAFEDCTVGGVKAKRCKVKLTRDQRALWIYAYIYVRPTSLTFLTVRPDSEAGPAIERYLGTVRFLPAAR
jgi:hypothetical protein